MTPTTTTVQYEQITQYRPAGWRWWGCGDTTGLVDEPFPPLTFADARDAYNAYVAEWIQDELRWCDDHGLPLVASDYRIVTLRHTDATDVELELTVSAIEVIDSIEIDMGAIEDAEFEAQYGDQLEQHA